MPDTARTSRPPAGRAGARVLLVGAVVALGAAFPGLASGAELASPEPSPSPSPGPSPLPCPSPLPSPSAGPSASPSPIPSPSPSATPDDCKDGKDGDGNGRGGKDRDGNGRDRKNRDGKNRDRKGRDDERRDRRGYDRGDRDRGARDRSGNRRGGSKNGDRGNDRSARRDADRHDVAKGAVASIANSYRAPKTYDTDALVALDAKLRSLGVDGSTIARRVYSPFIIGGAAVWTDTWGAPRYGPGPIIRTHEGQDVFCDYDAPILAAEDGTIEFDTDDLGGKVARLHREDGSYWYYAHLASFNEPALESGDAVEAGDIIGFCGNSGNAILTSPHVHFGWYAEDGTAKDPMRALVGWLREAEKRAGVDAERVADERIAEVADLTALRRFGDEFVPSTRGQTVSKTVLAEVAPAGYEAGLDDVHADVQAATAWLLVD